VSDPAEDNFQERMTYMLRLVSSALGYQVDRALKEFSLTHTQLGALSHLKLVRPGALSGAELGQRIGVTPQSMSTAVAALLARGLVEREPHPDHGRILQLRITPAGTEIRDRAQTAIKKLNDRILSLLDEEQQRQLGEILRTLMDGLDLYVPAPPKAATLSD
jgi:DNA-binding MarR family transcriptional regulator